MIVLSYRLYPSVLALLCCCMVMAVAVSDLRAQTTVTSLADRQRLAAALNAVLNSGGPVSISPPVKVVGASGLCEDANIVITDAGAYFKLKFQTKPAQSVAVAVNSHPLVHDLNAWLNKSWALRLDPSELSFSNLTLLNDNCNTGQKYYTKVKTDAVAASHIKYLTGASSILGKAYTTAGSTQLGSNIVTFDDASPNTVQYITDVDSNISQLARIYININNGNLKLTLKALTHPYDPECGVSDAENNTAPNKHAHIELQIESAGILSTCHKQWHGNADVANDELMGVYDKANTFTQTVGQFGNDANGYLTFTVPRLSGNICEEDPPEDPPGPSSTTYTTNKQLIPNSAPEEWCEETFCKGGTFGVDNLTGELYYTPPATSGCGVGRQPVLCISFCGNLPCYSRCLDGVIAATAQRYGEEWPYDSTEFGLPIPKSNEFETGKLGKWRPRASYVYSTEIIPGADPTTSNRRNYKNAGVFAEPFQMFTWKCPDIDDTTLWVKADTTTRYSPHGAPIEERDAIWTYSAARFDHQQTVPSFVAKNAEYSTVVFESFEDGQGSIETSPIAHSGRKSFKLTSANGYATPGSLFMVTLTPHVMAKGLLVKLWVKRTYAIDYFGTGASPVRVKVGSLTAVPMDSVAQTGEWTLYEYIVHPSYLTPLQTIPPARIPIVFSHYNSTIGMDIWVDDIRIQPYDAEMVCNVYDAATLRLVTQFDDQHFGMYYQYNGEGKLVRKLRETERGLRTIAETQYHTPLVERPPINGPGTTTPSGPPSPSLSVASNEGGDAAGGRGGNLLDTRKELLDVQIGLNNQTVRLLEGSETALSDLDRLELPALRELDLPDPEKLMLITKIKEIEEGRRTLEARRANASDPAELETIDEEVKKLDLMRAEILEETGISESDWLNVYEELNAIEDQKND